MKEVNIAVVGVTGMVGNMFLKVLEESNIKINNFYAFASSRSAGSKVILNDKEYTVEELTDQSFVGRNIDIALFSAGGSISEKFAPIAVESGCIVIDNSSYWRMHEDVPLVVPEVNAYDIHTHKGIIANPNCSTIQAVVALNPLKKFGLKRVVYSTYQAVSGAGVGGYNDLVNGLKGEEPKKFAYHIANNVIPQIDVFDETGYTYEELKMINETRKILHDDKVKVTATAVRVPVLNSHSESINVEFENEFDINEVFEIYSDSHGIVLRDDIKNNIYPMPIEANGSNLVFVGRVRRDYSVDNGLNIFVVADNIRKGAASNAVQIAEYVADNIL